MESKVPNNCKQNSPPFLLPLPHPFPSSLTHTYTTCCTVPPSTTLPLHLVCPLLPAAGLPRRADCPGQKMYNPRSCQAGSQGGWYDAQGQGVANDYCRYVGSSTLSPQGWFSCAMAGTPVGSCSDTQPGAYKQNPSNTSAIFNPHPFVPDESCINNGCSAFSQDMCGWTMPRSYAVNWVYPFNNPSASQYNYLCVCMWAIIVCLPSCCHGGRQ